MKPSPAELLLLIILLSGCSTLSTTVPENINLTGIWRLDPDFSDDPAKRIAAARSGGQRGKGSRGGLGSGRGGMGSGRGGMGSGRGGMSSGRGGMGSGRGGMGSGRGRGSSGMGLSRSQMRAFLDELQSPELDIEQRDKSTLIEYDGGKIEVYRWGEMKKGNRKIESGWKKDSFVLKLKRGKGPMLTRIFSVSEEGDTLTAITSFNKVKITQLYKLDREATDEAYRQ